MLNIFYSSLKDSIFIISIIFILMVVVEILILKYKKKILNFLDKNELSKYIISSFFGILPGCVGTFAMDTLYMSGLLGFGGIVAVMVATSGDEALILLSMAIKGEIAWTIVVGLTAILFFLGIFAGVLADKFKLKTKMDFCKKCEIIHHKVEEFKLKHFLKEHLYGHIIKQHIWKLFLWLFFAIFVIGLLQDSINLELDGANIFYVFIIAVLVGILPISGPNIFFLIMYSKGLIPFSVLLVNSIIQDGHGLLPIMGFSMDDAVKIKTFNIVFGVVIGLILLCVGF